MSIGTVFPLRTERLHRVEKAESLNNLYRGYTLPQNPGLATNNFCHPHQDSYHSESVGLTGPDSRYLRLIVQRNPYGFTPTMACNSANQMVGVSFLVGRFYLIVFNSECEIISATHTGTALSPHTFAGGYFFLNSSDNAVVVSGATDTLACYPTANVEKRDEVYSLDPIWKTPNLVKLITGSLLGNTFYMAMPVWCSADTNLYWVQLTGKYAKGEVRANSFVAVIKVVPDDSAAGATTTLVDKLELSDEWCNNPPAVGEEGVFVLTSACDDSGQCTSGKLRSIGFDSETNKMQINWSASYQSSGFLLPGMKNIGSGTAPTLFNGEDGVGYVAIGDSAYPRMNVVVYNRATGDKVSETPVFANMRSCDEASLIAFNGRIIAENNFGHTSPKPLTPQLVSNEPGMALVEVKGPKVSESAVVWENNHITVFGMSMLARESGVIFAQTGDWNVADSSTKGALYSTSAIDAWDGREIWRIPIGQGNDYCHEYGGCYFDRTGKRLFVGTRKFLVSIQNFVPSQLLFVSEKEPCEDTDAGDE